MGIDKIGYIAIALTVVFGVAGVLMMGPIAQDPGYHLFTDQRTVFNIPNFWNVVSSLPFLVVGVLGLYSILRSNRARLIAEMKAAYILFFLGVSLVAFGSGYYHLRPDNASLAWDRIPMALAFMALFSIIITEYVSLRWGCLLLWPLVLFGLFSVIYWYVTESGGEGDLRFYILVQFLPVLVIPLMLLFFKPGFTRTSGYWYLLGAYVAGKFFEYFDGLTQDTLIFLSGHTIKHLLTAVGVALLLKAFNHRKMILK